VNSELKNWRSFFQNFLQLNDLLSLSFLFPWNSFLLKGKQFSKKPKMTLALTAIWVSQLGIDPWSSDLQIRQFNLNSTPCSKQHSTLIFYLTILIWKITYLIFPWNIELIKLWKGCSSQSEGVNSPEMRADKLSFEII
jgi:hypothetical protein